MTGDQVVHAPRFGHPHPGISSAEIEGDFGDEAIAELEARGHALFPVSPRDANMGSIHSVRWLEDGTLEGVADPRRRGRASRGRDAAATSGRLTGTPPRTGRQRTGGAIPGTRNK